MSLRAGVKGKWVAKRNEQRGAIHGNHGSGNHPQSGRIHKDFQRQSSSVKISKLSYICIATLARDKRGPTNL